jgi:hypothetical protein
MSDKSENALMTIGTVVLRAMTVALDSETGKSFISDCARNTEGLLPDLEIRTRYGLSNEDWEGLAGNTQLLCALRTERERRVVSGEAAREAAQRHYAKAPDVLGGILADEHVSPRHRIEAAKELRQVAGNELDNSSGATEKFVININLGGDDEQLVYEKKISGRSSSPPDDGDLP